MKPLIIAIDGPSGAGKGTVARAVAGALGYRHVDSGAMYRAVGWKALRDGVPLDDEDARRRARRARRGSTISSRRASRSTATTSRARSARRRSTRRGRRRAAAARARACSSRVSARWAPAAGS